MTPKYEREYRKYQTAFNAYSEARAAYFACQITDEEWAAEKADYDAAVRSLDAAERAAMREALGVPGKPITE